MSGQPEQEPQRPASPVLDMSNPDAFLDAMVAESADLVECESPEPGSVELPPGMTKKVIQAGDGDECPGDNCEVTVHYKGTLEDGTEFDSSHSRSEPFTFTLGIGSVIKGWDIGIKTMKRSEIAEFSLPPELGYGKNGAPPKIPPNARLNFIIELIDWEPNDSAERELIHRMTFTQRLEKCVEKKTLGGQMFREAKYESAIRYYRDLMKMALVSEFHDDGQSVEFDSNLDGDGQAESPAESSAKSELRQMLLVGYLNLALCYLKVNKLKDCIQNCDEALKIDPKNVKAHFRKGLAHLPTNDYEKAIPQFDKVLELDPNNVEAKNQKAACVAALRAYNQKQKDMYKNLFTPRS